MTEHDLEQLLIKNIEIRNLKYETNSKSQEPKFKTFLSL